ncbi:adenylate kinase family protein [Mycoplasma sp. Z386]
MIKNIIFLGAPGVGKGTVASLLAKEIDFIHLSTGEIFRTAIRNQTKLGLELKNIVESGRYVPDNITNEIVKEKLEELNKQNINFILDGYPRTINQADFLSNLSTSQIKNVILLQAPSEVIIQRLSKRRYCPTCSATYHLDFKPSAKQLLCENDDTVLLQRKDDEEEAIIRRLEVYNNETKVLIDFYKDKNMLITIDATQTPEFIVQKIVKEIL